MTLLFFPEENELHTQQPISRKTLLYAGITVRYDPGEKFSIICLSIMLYTIHIRCPEKDPAKADKLECDKNSYCTANPATF